MCLQPRRSIAVQARDRSRPTYLPRIEGDANADHRKMCSFTEKAHVHVLFLQLPCVIFGHSVSAQRTPWRFTC